MTQNNQIDTRSVLHTAIIHIKDYTGKQVASILMPNVNFMTTLYIANSLLKVLSADLTGNDLAKEIVDLFQESSFSASQNTNDKNHQLGYLDVFDQYYARKIWPDFKLNYDSPAQDSIVVAISKAQQAILTKRADQSCELNYQTKHLNLHSMTNDHGKKVQRSIALTYQVDILNLPFEQVTHFFNDLEDIVNKYQPDQFVFKTPKKEYFVN